jgi:DNA-nicking Smr family endonuclease
MGKAARGIGKRADGDSALWHRAMRDVAPLLGRTPAPAPVPAKPSAAAVPAMPVEHSTSAQPPLGQHAGLDRASAQRLKRGMVPIEARLDLHGMTQAEAHRALGNFVAASRAAGKRGALVITGQGRAAGRPEGGVLKNAVPRWLEEAELRQHILACTTALPRDGGGGALYLLLRKRRS